MPNPAHAESPQWGEQSGVAPWLMRMVGKLAGYDALRAIYKSIGPTQGPVDFATRALSTMRIDCEASEQSLARIPASGRVIIVANHPFGALDGLAAIGIIGKQRPDVRILANADLASIAELAPMILSVDPFAGQGST